MGTAALKYALATLIQRFAVAFLHHVFQQALHGFYPLHQMVKFREFLAGEGSPSLRGSSDIAETEKQLADFVQRKTELAGTLDDCQAIEGGFVVASLPAHPQGGRKKTDSLVIANRGRLQADLPGDLGNGH